MFACMCIWMSIYLYACVYTYIYIYIDACTVYIMQAHAKMHPQPNRVPDRCFREFLSGAPEQTFRAFGSGCFFQPLRLCCLCCFRSKKGGWG